MKQNALTKILGIDYPIIQAGMVWVSGGKLAGAASKAGCLGVIGAGSMKPDLLRHHIQKAKSISDKALAVNLPIMYPGCPEQIEVALEEGIRIFITSAGSPKKYTQFLKDKGCVVIHVTSTPELAKKCEAAGVDAIIAEGFEAGGHNGRDEITTMTLIPQVVDAVKIPVIAAGGIGDGRAIVAALALGAQGVQMGTRFLMTQESSAHENFKNLLLNSTPGSTKLSMKELVPVRLFKNKFFEQVQELELKGASKEELQKLLGKGRAKAGMLDGDLDEGELEVGQICSLTKDIPTVGELVTNLIDQVKKVKRDIC
ncbi:MAG: nitronate monooxygenase [Peredibacter sp.]|nr:nitronate monooxygenase [Peredibacter sp.]|tara:strand:- start:2580 stop:3518 length:939 start_codon:yes stop_codon:yes gene_type:complete